MRLSYDQRASKKQVYAETLADTLTLDPIQQYQQRNNFPIKLIVILLLALLTSYEVMLVTGSNFQMTRRINRVFNYNLLDKTSNDVYFADDIINYNIQIIYSINDIIAHFEKTFKYFRELNSYLFQELDQNIIETQANTIESYYTYQAMFQDKKFLHNRDGFTDRVEFTIKDGIITPFNMKDVASIQKYLSMTSMFVLNFRNIIFYFLKNDGQYIQTRWQATIKYLVIDNSKIQLNVLTNGEVQPENIFKSQHRNNNLKEFQNNSYKRFLGLFQTNVEQNLKQFFQKDDRNKPNRQKFQKLMNQNKILQNKRNIKSYKSFIENESWEEWFSKDQIKAVKICIFICGIISLVLHVKYILKIIDVYSDNSIASRKQFKIRHHLLQNQNQHKGMIALAQKYEIRGEQTIMEIIQDQKLWTDLNLKEKLAFFDFWLPFTIMGNLLQIFSSLPFIFSVDQYRNNENFGNGMMVSGLSCFFAWISTLQFIEYNDSVFLLSFIMKRTLPLIIQFFMQCSLVLIGFVVVGMCFFGQFTQFGTFSDTMNTIWSIIFGNEIYETFNDLRSRGFSSILFTSLLVIFSFLFMQNLLMTIFVSIVYDKRSDEQREQSYNEFIQNCPGCHQKSLNVEKNPEDSLYSPVITYQSSHKKNSKYDNFIELHQMDQKENFISLKQAISDETSNINHQKQNIHFYLEEQQQQQSLRKKSSQSRDNSPNLFGIPSNNLLSQNLMQFDISYTKKSIQLGQSIKNNFSKTPEIAPLKSSDSLFKFKEINLSNFSRESLSLNTNILLKNKIMKKISKSRRKIDSIVQDMIDQTFEDMKLFLNKSDNQIMYSNLQVELMNIVFQINNLQRELE